MSIDKARRGKLDECIHRQPLPATLSNVKLNGLAFRGVVAILFGIRALACPGATPASLIIVRGAYAFVDGAFALCSGMRGGSERRWTFILFIGCYAVVYGLSMIASAVQLRSLHEARVR
ncbi:DUF308 domain-containing protein [Caballeronia sp. J97]|uniref:DUF308 domain-containing protein n=1 Tax=Caballeronia sp. J97 TaxID=2805429 RepID=UPI002AB233BC|nr:DUF308 domain-containing protein [Caballeronia sp. J97]